MQEKYNKRLVELADDLDATVDEIYVTGEELPHHLVGKIKHICGFIQALKQETSQNAPKPPKIT